MNNLSRLCTVLCSSSMLLALLSISNAEEYKASDFTQAEVVVIQQISLYGNMAINWERLKKLLVQRFDRQEKGGQGISTEDVDLTKMVREATTRAAIVQKWLRYDLDGDGSVTQKELEALSKQPLRTSVTTLSGINVQIKPTPEQSEMVLNQIMESANFPDENKDGTITLDEMLKASNETFNATTALLTRYNRNIGIEFDTDKDGIVQKDEYLKVVYDVFVRFDKNKNDILERKERDALQDASLILNQ